MDQDNLVKLSDHDILLLLSQTVKTNHTILKDQMYNLSENVNDIKSGIYKQLADHEARIRIIEDIHTKLDPVMVKEQVEKNTKALAFYSDAYKIFFGIVVLLNILYGLVITNIINLHKLFLGGK